tara:strand:+ start:464 stop:1219 length:756 start_codon:yes stop_codon:yes gene_type:complete
VNVKNINSVFKSKNIQDYLKLLNKSEYKKRMNSNKYRTYEDNCINFTNKEKIHLKMIIKNIKSKINRYRIKKSEWNIIKTRNNLEYGRPFTLDRYIFIPEGKIYDNNIEETLLHEFIHIDQRYNQLKYNNLYEKYLDWYRLDNIKESYFIKNNKIINPDGVDNNWYFHYKGNKIIPYLIYYNNDYNIEYYILEEDKIEKKYENEEEIREYLVNKYNINENYYHPNEIITTILSKYIINNNKIDKKLLHFIN